MDTKKTPHAKRSPHPYSDVIKAWAYGFEVQYKLKDSQSWRDTFIINGEGPGFNKNLDWRIKPVESPQLPHHKYNEGKFYNFNTLEWEYRQVNQEQEKQQNYFEQFKAICKGIADGKEIQYRRIGTKEWFDGAVNKHNNEFAFLFSYHEFRMKPDTQIIRYQNYLCKHNIILCWASSDDETKEDAENDVLEFGFIKWIGDEQTITIEVDDEN